MPTSSEEPSPEWRRRARRALEHHFERKSSPRLILTLILIVTGGVGFGLSIALLHLGMHHMWIRYPLAVLGAYAVFLGLIRLWVQFEKSRFEPNPSEIGTSLDEVRQSEPVPTWRPRHDRSGSWLDWLDFPDLFDLDEGCVLVLAAGVVIGAIALLAFAVMSAPTLLAEVFIDAFVVSVLYRRLRVAAREHWLGTAIRKTIGRALLLALLLSLGGWCLELLAPGSRSIGPAIHKILNEYGFGMITVHHSLAGLLHYRI